MKFLFHNNRRQKREISVNEWKESANIFQHSSRRLKWRVFLPNFGLGKEYRNRHWFSPRSFNSKITHPSLFSDPRTLNRSGQFEKLFLFECVPVSDNVHPYCLLLPPTIFLCLITWNYPSVPVSDNPELFSDNSELSFPIHFTNSRTKCLLTFLSTSLFSGSWRMYWNLNCM